MRQTNHVIEFLKIARGGERFWVEVLSRNDDGYRVKCANYTSDPDAPRYGDEFEIPVDEEVFETEVAAPKLRVVP
jgi:hypothetical protein